LQVIDSDIREFSGSSKQYPNPFLLSVLYIFLSQQLPVSVTWMWVSKHIMLVRLDFHRSSAAENSSLLGCVAMQLDEHCLLSDEALLCTGL